MCRENPLRVSAQIGSIRKKHRSRKKLSSAYASPQKNHREITQTCFGLRALRKNDPKTCDVKFVAPADPRPRSEAGGGMREAAPRTRSYCTTLRKAGDMKERPVDLERTVIAHNEAAKVAEPSERPLDRPAPLVAPEHPAQHTCPDRSVACRPTSFIRFDMLTCRTGRTSWPGASRHCSCSWFWQWLPSGHSKPALRSSLSAQRDELNTP
jgi:hypothetical protein